MTALSFWQPYAWLIVNGHADVDSRLWSPPAKRMGERIVIHASKRKVTRQEFQDFLESMKALGIQDYPQSPDDFDYGKLVGSVVISEVTRTSKSHWAARGYYHWLLESPRKMKPRAQKGQRGWFTVEL